MDPAHGSAYNANYTRFNSEIDQHLANVAAGLLDLATPPMIKSGVCTIEVIDERENVLAQGRFGTDCAGYRTMLAVGRRYPQRIWAVEGCTGVGRHLAQRLVADGETVFDVPAKLSARARVFATGQGRKSDPVDAHSVAVAALRAKGLRQVTVDGATVALRLWSTAATPSDGLAPI